MFGLRLLKLESIEDDYIRNLKSNKCPVSSDWRVLNLESEGSQKPVSILTVGLRFCHCNLNFITLIYTKLPVLTE